MQKAVEGPDENVEERRGAKRHKAADVPSITSVRLSPLGIQARLVDISTTGALVECANRIQPKSSLSLSFEGTNPPPPVSGRVARTTVAALDGGGMLRYHVGIAFATPIVLSGALADVAAAVLGAPAEDGGAPVRQATPGRDATLVREATPRETTLPPEAAPVRQPAPASKPAARNRW